MASPTILICEDEPVLRELMRVSLGDRYSFAEAGDVAEAIELAHALQPDLVLLDVQLPDLDGFEVASLLAALKTPPRVVLTSTRPAESFRRRLASSSALGFISKSDLSGSALAALV
jgi:CheY-like chemotaxis protein